MLEITGQEHNFIISRSGAACDFSHVTDIIYKQNQ